MDDFLGFVYILLVSCDYEGSAIFISFHSVYVYVVDAFDLPDSFSCSPDDFGCDCFWCADTCFRGFGILVGCCVFVCDGDFYVVSFFAGVLLGWWHCVLNCLCNLFGYYFSWLIGQMEAVSSHLRPVQRDFLSFRYFGAMSLCENLIDYLTVSVSLFRSYLWVHWLQRLFALSLPLVSSDWLSTWLSVWLSDSKRADAERIRHPVDTPARWLAETFSSRTAGVSHRDATGIHFLFYFLFSFNKQLISSKWWLKHVTDPFSSLVSTHVQLAIYIITDHFSLYRLSLLPVLNITVIINIITFLILIFPSLPFWLSIDYFMYLKHVIF